jgi:sporulation protein YlmC with PRC-barrel domain
LATKKDISMKTLSFLIATTSIALSLGLAAPVFAETTTKVMLTKVDPSVLTTAWRATDIIGTNVFDDNGAEIGTVKDVASGSIPFVIITNIPGSDDRARNVVVSASDFELVGKKLTMHGGSAAVLLSAPIF